MSYALLGDVVQFIRGVTFKPEDLVEPGTVDSVVVMRTKNIQSSLDDRDLIAVPVRFVRRKEQFLREGDILLSSANSWELVGKSCIVPSLEYVATAGGFISIVRPNENLLDARYFYHWITSGETQHKVRHCGRQTTNISNLDVGRFLELEIPLPPLAEQKRIAAILDKADALRRKRQQAIDLADQFLRSVFLDMFGDPVTNPKGWEDLSLGELIAAPLQNGAYYPKEHYVDSGVEMVHMSDAFYDVVQRGTLKRVAAPNKDVEKYALTEDDILISRRSLNLEGAAKPSLIPISDEPLIFESSMIRVTTDQSRLLPKYLFAFLSHPLVKTSRVFQYVTGATIKGISQSNLAKVQVLVPAIELQREFVGVMNCIDELKLKSLKSGLEIEQAFSSLSQQAFSGQL